MKGIKYKKRLIPLLFALVAALIVAACALCGGRTISAGADSSDKYYGFEFSSYSVKYDVRDDYTMDVTLDIGVTYTGLYSTGIIYDIPVNDGDRVRKLSACEVVNGVEEDLDYSVENDSDYVSVDMGDSTRKTGTTHFYRITYVYEVTKPESLTHFYLNAIGSASEGEINDITVEINLPDGFIGAKCYVGYVGSTSEYTGFTAKGNKVTLSYDKLSANNGVTFEFEFEEGALSTKFDFTPYIVVIIGCVILAALFAVKLLKFTETPLAPIVNFDAANGMDPLAMGKLIDGKIDSEDVTSLIYYWASKGFLKINAENKDDPELIRIRVTLPESYPAYQKIMYRRLFIHGDCVRISALANTFYSTVDEVKKGVNASYNRLYDGKSTTVSMLFAVLGALVMCLTPIVLAMATISSKMLIILPLFMIIPAFVVYALTQTLYGYRLKLGKAKKAVLYAGIVLLAAAFSAVYVLAVPSYIIELAPKILLCAVGFTTVILSVFIICRTKEYTESLNKILGFRDFILYTEKEKLEAMLEDNPDFYYNILPYAQVLGISDIWEDKFKSLTVKPPEWINGTGDMVFDVIVLNALMRSMSMRMVQSFTSRPAPRGASMHGHSGHGGFGGHVGGGHGGGGFRGR